VCLRCEGEAGTEGAPGVGEAAGARPRQHRSEAGGGDFAVHARARPRPGARASLPCHPLAACRVSPGMCEDIAGLFLLPNSLWTLRFSHGSWVCIAAAADAGEVRTGGSRRCAHARPFRVSKGESSLCLNWFLLFVVMPVTPDNCKVICIGELVQDTRQ
jgi:hypothetical protein